MTTMARPGTSMGTPRGSALAAYLERYQRLSGQHSLDLAVINALRLKRADALVTGVFENSFDAIAIIGGDGRIESANNGLARLFGCEPDALRGGSFFALLAEDGAERLRPVLVPDGPAQRDLETTAVRADGATFPVEINVGTIAIGGDYNYVAIVRDITERRRQQEMLEHQALHDALTRLPNRLLFDNRLEHAIAAAERGGEPLAVLLIDLDRFKEVNDTLGHHAGDQLLRDVAARLCEAVRKGDTVARLGGDEFAVLFPAVGSEALAWELTGRLLEALGRPFELNGLPFDVAVSTGIALYPQHATDKDRLLQYADVAMYAAKREQVGVSLYDPARDGHSLQNLMLPGELRKAIEQHRIFLMYQPKLDLETGRITGVEALARWNHEEYGAITPARFVIEAERTGLIGPLTALTLDLGLSQIAAWRAQKMDLTLALNLSAQYLQDPSLPDLMAAALERWQVRPEWVTLEITESALWRNLHQALEVAERLAAMGVRLSIDDFGTGFTSISHLMSMPVSELKIDKSCILHMLEREKHGRIVQSTIDFAHNLGLKVVAEGVENAQILARLRDLGCDVAQGYLLGKPMLASDQRLPSLLALGGPPASRLRSAA
jgi:diguanylate cyclase (GGDEF)-like protein/PAS domain S-box-containing protein